MDLRILAFTAVLTTASLSAQNPPVPSAFQDLYNTMATQIAGFNTAVNSGWDGSSYAYLNAPQLPTANSNGYTTLLTPYYYSVGVTEQLEELQALGANAVTVHIDFPTFYQPFYTYAGDPSLYQQFVSFYQQLAQDVRARGMKLVVEATFGMPLTGANTAQFQSYAQSLTWSEYMAGRAANALAVAELIQPDYMTVMTEPDTEATDSGQNSLNGVTGATQLVQQILTTLKNAGIKNIQVGAGAGTWTKNYMQYVQALAALPLNFVDMHIYPINYTLFTNALTAADTIHAAGKQVAMSEYWDYKVRNNELGVLDMSTLFSRDPFSFWAPIDISFLQAVVNFAKYKQLAFLSPFWVDYFFAYLDYNTYGLLANDTIITDSYSAASNAISVGGFTSAGRAWETQNIPADKTPPATPAAPTTTAIGPTVINLAWTADTDNVGVSAYNLYRNGTLLSTTSQLLYYDSGLVPGESYTYRLTAVDASGNVSGMSAPLIVETIDTTPPSVPTNLVVTNVTAESISISWKLSTGIGGVEGYRILFGTTPTALSIVANVTAPPYTINVAPLTTYYFEVESYNPLGATSGPSNLVSATTTTSAPTVPKNLVVTAVSSGSISLNWAPSTGPIGVEGYVVLQGTSPTSMTPHATVGAPPYTDTVARSKTYYFQVEAYNSIGVMSGRSNAVRATAK